MCVQFVELGLCFFPSLLVNLCSLLLSSQRYCDHLYSPDKGEESFHVSCLLPPVVNIIAIFWCSLRGKKKEFLLHSIFFPHILCKSLLLKTVESSY